MKNFFLYNNKIFFIKSKKKFYNNLGIRAVIIYFALCLTVCVMVFMRIICIMVFTLIVSFKIIIISIKSDEQKNCARNFQICNYAFFNI